MKKKSILEQALLQVETLEEAVKQNAKGILASTMKQELNDLLKEQEEEDDEEIPTDVEDDVTGDLNPDDENLETVKDDEPESVEGLDGLEDDEPSVPESTEDDDDLDNLGDENLEDDDDVLDMTGASDEEVIKVYKSMSPDDGVVVKKDGNKIEFTVNDEDFIIKLDEQEEDMFNLDGEGFEEDGEETVYEIELGEEEEDEKSEDEKPEAEFDEAARTLAYGVRGPRQKKMFKAGRTNALQGLNEQVKTLKKQNNEYKKALVLFKEKLNEVAVFNANLAYATRLFTEHTTTKQEKLEILKRFDTVSTITESKNLYGQIKTELDNKKPITESVSNKISSTPQTSSSKEVLSESKAYENPQFKRMKELMGKINKIK